MSKPPKTIEKARPPSAQLIHPPIALLVTIRLVHQDPPNYPPNRPAKVWGRKFLLALRQPPKQDASLQMLWLSKKMLWTWTLLPAIGMLGQGNDGKRRRSPEGGTRDSIRRRQ